MPNPRSPYPPEFREEALRRYATSGRSLSAVSRDLGVSFETLRRWVNEAEVGAGEKAGLTGEERSELVRLRRENETLRMEADLPGRAKTSTPSPVAPSSGSPGQSSISGQGHGLHGSGDQGPARWGKGGTSDQMASWGGTSVDLREALRWRWRLFLTVVLVVAIGAGLYVGAMSAKYAATSIVAVVPNKGVQFPGADYISLSAPSFIAYATSTDTLRPIAKANGTSVEALKGSVDASVSGSSNTIVITARSPSAREAADEANQVAKAMTFYSDRAGLVGAVQVATADVPTHPSAPLRRLGILAGLLAGIAAGLSLVYIMERRRPHLSDPTMLSQIVGHGVLGTLPRSPALKQGRVDGSRDPWAEAAIRLLGASFQRAVGAGGGATLVTAPANGDGVSTVCLALASALTRTGSRVLIVRATAHDIRRERPVGAASEPDQDGASDETEHAATAARILSLTEADGPVVDAIRRLLPEAVEQFDVVIIDAPPILEGGLTLEMAETAHAVLFVASAGDLAAKAQESALILESLGSKVVGIVGNRMPWWVSTA